MRGEDTNVELMNTYDVGSPPHARGRLDVVALAAAFNRITPACAGKTSTTRKLERRYWDHPRMRGEDNWAKRVFDTSRGSPPHARGRRQGAL